MITSPRWTRAHRPSQSGLEVQHACALCLLVPAASLFNIHGSCQTSACKLLCHESPCLLSCVGV